MFRTGLLPAVPVAECTAIAKPPVPLSHPTTPNPFCTRIFSCPLPFSLPFSRTSLTDAGSLRAGIGFDRASHLVAPEAVHLHFRPLFSWLVFTDAVLLFAVTLSFLGIRGELSQQCAFLVCCFEKKLASLAAILANLFLPAWSLKVLQKMGTRTCFYRVMSHFLRYFGGSRWFFGFITINVVQKCRTCQFAPCLSSNN